MARKKHARPEGAEEELQLSRAVAADYYSSKLRSRGRKRIALSVLAAILTVFLGTAVAAAAFVNDINTKITGSVSQKLMSELKPQEAGKPFYLLLIGIERVLDGRRWLMYVLVTALMLIVNFYFAYMNTLVAVAYILVRLAFRLRDRGAAESAKDGLMLLGGYLLGAALSDCFQRGEGN